MVQPQSEQRIESSTKSVSANHEQQMYDQMLSILAQTNTKLDHLFSSSSTATTNPTKGVSETLSDSDSLDSSSSTEHRSALPLDSSLTSEWLTFYDEIDLLFTVDEPCDAESDNMRARMERLVRATQEHFCHEIQALEGRDGGSFTTDLWKRPSSRCGVASKHAGGLSKVLVNGRVFEKAGVSVSISSGKLPKRAVQQMTANHTELQQLLNENKLGDEDGNVQYYAASVSSVCHPWNPHGPTGHFNYRYFELGDVDPESGAFQSKVWWFGGGGDLSPSILDETDCRHFHGTFKKCCDKHDVGFYAKFKKWCDNYFVIKHRDNERRGIGGIFFDDLTGPLVEGKGNEEEKAMDKKQQKKELIHDFVMECASHWSEAYIPLVRRHVDQSYSEQEKEWQQIRRGRYVEFNLVYDRGTKFGLMKPGARIESILMSMPLTARWDYCRNPVHEFEHEMYEIFKNPKEWV